MQFTSIVASVILAAAAVKAQTVTFIETASPGCVADSPAAPVSFVDPVCGQCLQVADQPNAVFEALTVTGKSASQFITAHTGRDCSAETKIRATEGETSICWRERIGEPMFKSVFIAC
ncbi:hypothetical protein BDV98DRAFT_586634 [Pterulicium gracile]|uniref:Uncharacterized protein n=1 Tax=Pterulicium gracile TaxID=1884261 RepID=A0A5C3Q6L5_9AGAR|nr:hypothetical protein BDV98DRAFT_586634 [Pterula gracilis]